MSDDFDSLTVLLKLLMPSLSIEDQFELLSCLNAGQTEAVIAEAKQQGVSLPLYPMLLALEKTYDLMIPSKEKLYQAYLSTAAKNMVALHEAERLLSTLKEAGIAAAGLKGIYLLENVYGNIGARSMNDIDILVKKQDLAKSLQIMQTLGYQHTGYFSLLDHNTDTKHVPPMQKAGGHLLEVHWTLLEEYEPFTIDIEALWARMVPAKIAGVEALALGVEDLILHLCLHLTYQHFLTLGLRGLLDIGLVLHQFADEINWSRLVETARSWGAEKVTALTLKLVESQLEVPIPAEVFTSLLPAGIAPELLENARSLLFERGQTLANLTPDLVEMSASRNLITKVKIGLQRVFIPRLALARIYNLEPNSLKIHGFYWVRLVDLFRSYGSTILNLQQEDEATESARQKAQLSYSLHEWMSPRPEC